VDTAGCATAEAEEAKEKQRVLDDGKYKKLIRGKKNTNGPLLAKYTIRSESIHFTIFVDPGQGEGGSGSRKKMEREGGVGRIAGGSRRGVELMEEDRCRSRKGTARYTAKGGAAHALIASARAGSTWRRSRRGRRMRRERQRRGSRRSLHVGCVPWARGSVGCW